MQRATSIKLKARPNAVSASYVSEWQCSQRTRVYFNSFSRYCTEIFRKQQTDGVAGGICVIPSLPAGLITHATVLDTYWGRPTHSLTLSARLGKWRHVLLHWYAESESLHLVTVTSTSRTHSPCSAWRLPVSHSVSQGSWLVGNHWHKKIKIIPTVTKSASLAQPCCVRWLAWLDCPLRTTYPRKKQWTLTSVVMRTLCDISAFDYGYKELHMWLCSF